MAFNQEKFTELILYVAQSTLNDPDFGAIKMAKALWRADFAAFATLGSPITGADYQHLEFGPAARQYLPVLEEMKGRNVAQEATQVIGGYPSRKVVAIRSADVTKFTPQELALIHSALDWVRGRTAARASDDSHGWAWHATKMNETIPYGSELFPDDPLPLSERAMEYGKEVSERLAAAR